MSSLEPDIPNVTRIKLWWIGELFFGYFEEVICEAVNTNQTEVNT